MTTHFSFVPSPFHSLKDHPECPGRFDLLDLSETPEIEEISAGEATWDEIGRVHTRSTIEYLEDACKRGAGIIDYAPTYVTATSFRDARLAVGATLAVTRSVLTGAVSNAFAIVRPPGHHAEPGWSMGFCLFNNIAIAAQDALAAGLKRVAVIDFDVHHGNGTQVAALEDERFGFLSTQQQGIYPGTTGTLQDAPDATGRIVNIPLPPRTGEQGFALIANEIYRPFIEHFRPEMIFVSAGFDAHWSDPLAALGLTSRGYYALAQSLVSLAKKHCDGKIVFVLEGGYRPENVANGIQAVFAALTGRAAPPFKDASPYPEPDIRSRVADVVKLHHF